MLSKIAALALVVLAADPAWVKQVEAWRAKHEADYTRDYVPLAGLAFLKEGVNSAGSSPSNQVVLPRRLPATVGRFIYRAGRITFEPSAGAGRHAGGKTVDKPDHAAVRRRQRRSRSPAHRRRLVLGAHERRPARDPHPRSAEQCGARRSPATGGFRSTSSIASSGGSSRTQTPRELKIPTLVGDLRRVPHRRRRGVHAARSVGQDAAR